MEDGNVSFTTRKVVDLIPYARNARTHPDAQIARIAGSIREFGFINPVVIDGENGIIAGHGRVLAARKIGLEEVPCVEASHLTEAQKRAYILADNRTALDAEWDEDLLRVELSDLESMGFDLELTGFDIGEVKDLFDGGLSEGGDEEVPDDKYSEQYGVIVVCSSEAEQQKAYEELRDQGYNCRVVTT